VDFSILAIFWLQAVAPKM